MSTYSYSERDYTFGQSIATLRTALGLTQAELAQILHVSRRAVGSWETGASYPKAEHLKMLIELCIKKHTFFSTGHEAEEIRALWKAAHQKVLVDEQWLSTLLSQSRPPLTLLPPQSSKTTMPFEPARMTQPLPELSSQPTSGPWVDWGDALAVPTFYGRERELELLEQWIVQERCRMVSILGIGGIGKSALSVSLMHRVIEHFQVVIFRSLRDAPPCDALLNDCLQMFSPQLLSTASGSLERRIGLLIEQLRKARTLIVLDNLETLLEEGDVKGRFRAGLEGYETLLRQVAETEHQSCLLLTSREKPAGLRAVEGKHSPVRSLRLSGLDVVACEQLLAEKEAVGTPQDQAHLVAVYGGNPLALKIVAETIADLFGGEISQFLSSGALIFGSISDLLSEQFTRLSPLEQTVLLWLTIAHEPVTIDELQAMLVAPLPRIQMLEAIDSLRRRSLIERGQRNASFTLHAVVLEYVTSVLIEEVTKELQQQQPLFRFIEFGLEQASAKEYVRQAQQRLIVVPILAQLYHAYHGRGEVEEQLLSLLNQLRERANYAQGYGPANLIALLREHRGNLQGIDLSYLVIRGAYLQGVEMQDASLAGAILRDTIFNETFDATWAVAVSGNGEYWAAASKRGEVRVWENGGQTLHRVWQAHTDTTYALAFSPDGRTLVSGSWDDTVKLWDMESGALLWSGWHIHGALCVAFIPDGSLLATGGNDATVRLWDLQNGMQIQTLSHPNPILSVAWSSDGRLLACGDSEGNIRLWMIQKAQPATCVAVFTGHTNRVRGLAFAPDSGILASASWDGTVKLWETTSGRQLQTLTGHTDRANRVAWSPDGHILASCGFDKTIWLWDVKQEQYRAALHGHTAGVNGLAFTPDNRSLLTGSEDGTMRVWDVEKGQCIRIIQGYAASLFDVDWSPTGAQLVSGGTDTLVTIWEPESDQPPRILHGHSGVVFGVGWSPDGSRLASSAWDNVIRLWDPATGTSVHALQDPRDPGALLFGTAWSPDGQQLATGTYMHGVQMWEITTYTSGWIGGQIPTWIRHVAWSPDGTRLVGGGDDGNIYLWNASDGTLLLQLPGHQGVVTSVAWSPDGTQLVSTGRSRVRGELLVWDVETRKVIRSIVEPTSIIYAVAWGPGGNLLISGGSDGMLRWWEVHSGECVQARQAHQGTIRSLRRSPDGRWLASCGDDGAIILWDLHSGEYLRTLRRDRPYERVNITGIEGLTEAQKETLQALGAIEDSSMRHTF
jgi:WD40 repeat protein/transcriptional regulator with XRE-family HTH domain